MTSCQRFLTAAPSPWDSVDFILAECLQGVQNLHKALCNLRNSDNKFIPWSLTPWCKNSCLSLRFGLQTFFNYNDYKMWKTMRGDKPWGSYELTARACGLFQGKVYVCLVSCTWARQLSRNVLAYAGSLCDKTAVLRYTIKETPCIIPTTKNYDKLVKVYKLTVKQPPRPLLVGKIFTATFCSGR